MQAGDFVAFGKLAWDVYNYGFASENNADKHYTDFGNDVRGLAQQLDVLTSVIGKAHLSLREQVRSAHAVVRWNPVSVREIIGNYEETLRECQDLINANRRYATSSNVLKNIEWNMFVQPNADRLRQRIMLHQSKIQQFLRPFELDLLCRVREDIQRMHADLANRMTAMHYDIRRIMGVVIPDLETELDQRNHGQAPLLDVPKPISERFKLAALTDRPHYVNEEEFALWDLSDAFAVHFDRSTRTLPSHETVPSLEQYLNLLKCIWLFQRMKGKIPENEESDSHWPSYVRQLEVDLSSECTRFVEELTEPEVPPAVPKRMLMVWPPKERPPLVDVVILEEKMEEVFGSQLESPSEDIERGVVLLRRLGHDGSRFRILITGTDLTGEQDPHTEVIDFDLSSCILSPQYALPASRGLDREILLQRDERLARLAFPDMKQLLKFQNAVTGHKSWDTYIEYNVRVDFIETNAERPRVELACVQLWIAKPVDGSIVTTKKPETRERAPSRSQTMMSITSLEPGRSRGNSGTYHGGLPNRQMTSLQSMQRPGRSDTMFSSSWGPRQSSPSEMGSSPPRGHRLSLQGASSSPGHRSPLSHRPVPIAQPYQQPSSYHTPQLTHMLSVPPASHTYSLSSATPTSGSGSSSGSNNYNPANAAASHGSIGIVHRKPPKPRLVLFTQHPETKKVSLVTIDIDDGTTVNVERCDCRRAGSQGASCCVTSIEHFKGKDDLAANRFDPSPAKGEVDWNMARLALSKSGTKDETTWSSLKRVSLTFATPDGRARFSGTSQCGCRNKTAQELSRCRTDGHKGALGQVQEHYRRALHNFQQSRYKDQKEVVIGAMG